MAARTDPAPPGRGTASARRRGPSRPPDPGRPDTPARRVPGSARRGPDGPPGASQEWARVTRSPFGTAAARSGRYGSRRKLGVKRAASAARRAAVGPAMAARTDPAPPGRGTASARRRGPSRPPDPGRPDTPARRVPGSARRGPDGPPGAGQESARVSRSPSSGRLRATPWPALPVTRSPLGDAMLSAQSLRQRERPPEVSVRRTGAAKTLGAGILTGPRAEEAAFGRVGGPNARGAGSDGVAHGGARNRNPTSRSVPGENLLRPAESHRVACAGRDGSAPAVPGNAERGGRERGGEGRDPHGLRGRGAAGRRAIDRGRRRVSRAHAGRGGR